MHMRAQDDGAGTVPVARWTEHSPTACLVAGLDRRGDRTMAVKGIARLRLHGRLVIVVDVGFNRHQPTSLGTERGDIEILIAKGQRLGQQVHNRLRLSPGIGLRICLRGRACFGGGKHGRGQAAQAGHRQAAKQLTALHLSPGESGAVLGCRHFIHPHC